MGGDAVVPGVCSEVPGDELLEGFDLLKSLFADLRLDWRGTLLLLLLLQMVQLLIAAVFAARAVGRRTAVTVEKEN